MASEQLDDGLPAAADAQPGVAQRPMRALRPVVGDLLGHVAGSPRGMLIMITRIIRGMELMADRRRADASCRRL